MKEKELIENIKKDLDSSAKVFNLFQVKVAVVNGITLPYYVCCGEVHLLSNDIVSITSEINNHCFTTTLKVK